MHEITDSIDAAGCRQVVDIYRAGRPEYFIIPVDIRIKQRRISGCIRIQSGLIVHRRLPLVGKGLVIKSGIVIRSEPLRKSYRLLETDPDPEIYLERR